VNLDQITKEDFEDYERVRRGGRRNMRSREAQLATGLDRTTYLAVLEHYSELLAKWPEVRKG